MTSLPKNGFNIELSGSWQLASADGEIRSVITLPGDVHTALHRAGLIPDPYFGRNEEKVQWVAQREWVVERSFTLPDAEGDWYLDIDYLDTVASVHVNGFLALEADNSFRRYRPDVSSMLKKGENTIRIVFASSIATGAERQKKQPFYIPYSTGNSPIPDGNMLRKPQCHFGWDWNIAIAPLGLYGTIALKKLETARIEHVLTRQTHNADGSVELQVTATLYAKNAGIAQLYFDLDGERVRLDVGVNPGEADINHVFQIDNPRLWWPSGSGEQALYTLTVELDSDSVTKQIGLRTIELITTPDAAGSRFAFKVNGHEIFCRGANWIPADALFSLSSQEKTEDLLQSAKAANMNMIRVWGGGFYEHDWFYDICDRLGLMVWQDFMFACNLYPSTEDFLENVAVEVDYQVRRLSSHASIALWCGDNELVGALTWFEESRKDRDRYLVSYDRLNRTIEQSVKKAMPGALWWPSSPASGYLDFGDAWHADGSGDMHYWSVWHENKSFDNYRSVQAALLLGIRFPVLYVAACYQDLCRRQGHECRVTRHGAAPEERRRQRAHCRHDVPLLPLPEGFPEFRLSQPNSAGSGDQDGGGILAFAEAALHGHDLLAAQRHLAGGLLVEPRLRWPLEGDALSRQALLPAGGGRRHSVRRRQVDPLLAGQ